MRREDAERLLHHHYRLHTQVKSRIDNKPPKSMFVSPKSIHYKSFANRVTRPKSLDNLVKTPPKRRGQDELAHFVSRQRVSSVTNSLPSQSANLNGSFNAYARRSMTNITKITPSTASTSAASSRPPTSKPLFDASGIRARILDDRNYAPPLRRSGPPSIVELNHSLRGLALQDPNLSQKSTVSRGKSPNTPGKPEIVQSMIRARTASANAARRRQLSSSENVPDRVKNAMAVTLGKEYQEFKDTVLSNIIRRGVFNDRVIKDSFYKEIERRRDLDLNQMEVIMFDTLAELDVKTVETLPAPPPSRALRPQTAKPRKVTIAPPKPQRLIESDDGDSDLSIANDDEKGEESSSESSETASSKNGSNSDSSAGSATERSSKSEGDTPRAMSPNTDSSSSSGSDDGHKSDDNRRGSKDFYQ
uniref:Swi3 domain-containing protein n=1 Tax=Panagrellus redivivus TaxID=6233 RepID=A0A7E4VT96_PANRE